MIGLQPLGAAPLTKNPGHHETSVSPYTDTQTHDPHGALTPYDPFSHYRVTGTTEKTLYPHCQEERLTPSLL